MTQLRQYVPAREIVLIQTSDEEQAIARAQALGFPHRRYSGDLAFWLPEALELKEIIHRFDGIPLDSIDRQPVRLEHIYDEVLRTHLKATQKLVLPNDGMKSRSPTCK